MKNLTFIFILIFLAMPASYGSTIHCSHAELCKMANRITLENKLSDIHTVTLVNISGDPHEYEPRSSEIKNLINASILLTGPQELNPWIKKINFQRLKSLTSKTISIVFDPDDYKIYPSASGEALSHFWLYPKVYCSLKSKLESELRKLNYKIKSIKACDFKTAEFELKNALVKINMPVILTHDALLPLMLDLAKNNQPIVAIKGSGHHEEHSAKSIKKMYDALKAPQVIWIKEASINVPQNILNKIRSSDKLIELDTAKSLEENPFSVIFELSAKLNQLAEK